MNTFKADCLKNQNHTKSKKNNKRNLLINENENTCSLQNDLWLEESQENWKNNLKDNLDLLEILSLEQVLSDTTVA